MSERLQPLDIRMDQETHHGYLVLADIAGYTSYLAGVELTHAQDILTELLELLVEQFKPLLTVVKLEGDAVFAYVPQTEILRGEILLELLESTYLAFRDRVENIRRQTTCQCNACRAIPSLDLKFILHFGEYLLQNVSGITELVGSDVNLVHRLLKNHVSDATGWKAYVLFTNSGLMQMNVKLEGLHELVERYEHLGDVKTYSLDLHARYKELIDARRVFISPEESDRTITRTVSASPVVVWGWMNDVQKRLKWENYDDIRPLLRPGGRTTAGARNHCVHGKNLVLETILDWRPFVYYTTEYPMAIQSRYLEPLSDVTRLIIYFKLKMPVPRRLARLLARLMFKLMKVEQQFDTMVRLIEEEAVREESKG
jgi:class 3 adenylate cyclase